MPDRLSCDDAMRLARARLRVKDIDLKRGEIQMLTTYTALGPLPTPWGIQGGFAVVYKFCTQSGKMRALRLFLVPVDPDIQDRYERIGTYFATHARDITVEFKYHKEGIVIPDNTPGGATQTLGGQTQTLGNIYPLVEMEWIEGATLIDYVDELCRKRDQAGLGDLVEQWKDMIQTMRVARIAHGDLAGANVMVRPNGRMVLVDYDGVYIPDFAGRLPIVIGQTDYQHPQMNQRPFNEETDNFSALVIYTALLALHLQPDLWDMYTQQNKQNIVDKRLLFTQQDFIDPDQSALMTQLATMSDQRVREAVAEIKRACRQSVAQVQFPFHIIDPDFDKKQALLTLEQAIQADDDENIVQAWASPLLIGYAPRLLHLARVNRAQKTMQLLKTFRDGLQTRSITRIVAAYSPELDACTNVKPQERDLLRIAQSFAIAYKNDDDVTLVAIADEIRRLNYASLFDFTLQEIQRSVQAQQRKVAFGHFQQALSAGKVQAIVAAYDSILDGSTLVSSEERDLLQAAQNFMQAYQSDDDQQIIKVSDVMQNATYASRLIFTPQEQQRIQLARQRETALALFRRALANKSIQYIPTAYNPILDTATNVTSEERNLLRVARSFVQAYKADDDLALVAASTVIQQPQYAQCLLFTAEEERRILLAQQRKDALDAFRQALANQSAAQIVAAYNAILVSCKNVTQEEQEQLTLAQALLHALQQDNDQALSDVWDDIQRSRYPQIFKLTIAEQQRIDLAKRRAKALQQFRSALTTRKNDAEQIVLSYDTVLDDYQEVTAQERTLFEAARRCMDMQEAVLAAIRADNNEQIAAAYDAELARQFGVFTAQQQERIKRGLKQGLIERALQKEEYGRAIRLAQEIEMESHQQLTDPRLTLARQKFIRQFDVQNVEAWLQGDEVFARWPWPTDNLVRHAVILWRIDRWPHSPKREEQGTQRTWVFRNGNEQHCHARFKAVRQASIYLQVYFALPDETRGPGTWFYSRGHEPGSKKVAN